MRPFREGESLQNIIAAALPDFTEAEYPLFVEFIKTFLRYLESERTFQSRVIVPDFGVGGANGSIQETVSPGGSSYEARKLLDYRDIKTTLDEFKTHFLAMFARNFPQYSYIPADLLVRSLRQFYQGKGTPDSIKWFFRAYFNEDSEIYFPRVDIFKASDGTWSAPTTLKVSSPIIDPVTGNTPANEDVATFYVGQRIQTPTGSAQVEKVITTVVGQAFNQHIIVNELTLKFDTIIGSFEPNQTLHNIDSDTVVYTTILPVISAVIVNSGGSNYAVGDIVTFSEGPSGGYGYGAAGLVSAVDATALAGVLVLEGGDGYITGLPVTFTSSTGHGATAVISKVIYGNFLLEDDGFLLDESSSPAEPVFLILEDKNTLTLELTIEPFVNATATVTIDSSDYGTDAGVPQLVGVTIDSSIELALAAADEKPFMHPWVFTNAEETEGTLANAAVLLGVVSNTFFDNLSRVYAISTPLDITTTLASSNLHANVIVSDITSFGTGNNMLYLNDVVNLGQLVTGKILKQHGTGVSQNGTITTNGTANVVGANTTFASVLRANVHVRFADGSQYAVRTVVNNTFFQTFTPVTANLSANTWSIMPVGTVNQLTPQEQRYYGKIREVTLLTNGDDYASPPFVSADSISARVQAFFYLDPDPATVNTTSANNVIVAASGQIDVFENAVMEAQQSAGQVTKVKVTSSGVNYTDANSVVITAIHGNGRTGNEMHATPVLGAITQYPGRFTTTRSFASSDKYLQDADFYNNYTYVVKVAESFDRYRALLLKLMHPAGFKALGRFLEVITLDYEQSAADARIYQYTNMVDWDDLISTLEDIYIGDVFNAYHAVEV